MEERILTKGEQSRQAILNAAKTLIAKKGFNGVTLDELLSAASVTKGKFFHHFDSKDELFKELLRTSLTERTVLHFDSLIAEFRETTAFGALIRLIDTLIAWHVKGLPESMRLCLLATFFFSPTSPEMRRINTILSANSAVVEKLVKGAIAEGNLPKSIDPAQAALLFPSCGIGANIVGYLIGKDRLPQKGLTELKNLFVELSKNMVKRSR